MSKKKFLFIALCCNIAFMLTATIIIYISLTQPFYYYSDGSSSNALDYFKEEGVFWIVLPAISCIILVVSMKIRWLWIISAVLSFCFGVVSALGPALTESLNAFTKPWIGTSGVTVCSSASMIDWLSIISIILCFIRFIIAIFQYNLENKDELN